MSHAQPAILAPVPAVARFLVFGLTPEAQVRAALLRLRKLRLNEGTVVGLVHRLRSSYPMV